MNEYRVFLRVAKKISGSKYRKGAESNKVIFGTGDGGAIDFAVATAKGSTL